jgi:hypothetical protein
MGERKLGKPTSQSHGSSSPTEMIKRKGEETGTRGRKRGRWKRSELEGNKGVSEG